jgi:cyclic beta-1,2-glucan synthetase
MFEYLMPLILLRAPEGSLLQRTERAVVAAQRALSTPWGVSESGYNAFDLMMNYQYRAFGLPSLSLRGTAFERVIAPYASVLALPVDPGAAIEHLEVMRAAGLQGPMALRGRRLHPVPAAGGRGAAGSDEPHGAPQE